MKGYEIIGELGRGGMGVVYQAWQREANRIVALKMILSGANAGPDALARFWTEIEAVARLQHPHIIQIYEVGEQDGQPFFSMEFGDDGSLAQKLRGIPWPFRQAAELLETLARAIHYAHERGILHRDLTPGNVLLMADGTPKVTDFGLAKIVIGGGATQTQSGSILGTPSYMPPEQAAGRTKELGPAGDVYALGAILYEMLTGRPPFRAETPLETLRQVQSEEPVSPSRLQPKLPQDLVTICLKCLQKEPAKRYGSALELAEDLQRYLSGRPVVARRIGRPQQAWRWCRRNPMVAALTATVAVLLVAVAVGASVLSLQLRAALSRALDAEREANGQAHQAKAARKRTREALDEMGSDAINTLFTRQSQLLPEHKAFLGKMLKFYQEFAEQSDPSPEMRAEVANAHLRMGHIRRRLDERGQAETAYRRSQALYRQLTMDFARVPDYRQGLAASHTSLGHLLRANGRTPEAEEAFRATFPLFQRLAADFPGEPKYRLHLAGSHTNLGDLLRDTKRPEEAEAVYGEALRLERQLAAEFPTDPNYRQGLARSYNSLGNLLRTSKRYPEAEAAFRAALALFERLAKDFPAEPAYRLHLAGSHTNLGQQLLATDQTEEAEAAYRTALELSQRLAKDFPALPRYRQQVAGIQTNLGTLLETRRPQEAEAAYRAALPLRQQLVTDSPRDPDYQYGLAATLTGLARVQAEQQELQAARHLLEQALVHHQAARDANPDYREYRRSYRDNRKILTQVLVNLGEHATAADTAAQLVKAVFEPAEDFYTAAGLLARCVPLAEQDAQLPEARRKELAQKYGDRAIAVLRQAVQNGYKNLADLKQDAAFTSLRARADFQQLLAELEPK